MTPSRYLKIVGFSFVAILLVVWTAWQLVAWTAETVRTYREREALKAAYSSLNECSLKATRESFASGPRRIASDVLPVVLIKCRSEHQAYLTLTSDDAALRVWLLKGVEKEVERQKTAIEKEEKKEKAKREEGRKAALIEEAIKWLKKQGVGEDDIREYFREEEIEEYR